jgi:hypothetical protein
LHGKELTHVRFDEPIAVVIPDSDRVGTQAGDKSNKGEVLPPRHLLSAPGSGALELVAIAMARVGVTPAASSHCRTSGDKYQYCGKDQERHCLCLHSTFLLVVMWGSIPTL